MASSEDAVVFPEGGASIRTLTGVQGLGESHVDGGTRSQFGPSFRVVKSPAVWLALLANSGFPPIIGFIA